MYKGELNLYPPGTHAGGRDVASRPRHCARATTD